MANDLNSAPRIARLAALRYFSAVAEHGSFRAASESLGIAASAINRQITNLEIDLGAPLFDRQRGRMGLQLTEAGHILRARLRSAYNELRIANDEITAIKGLQRGHVIVGVNESLAGDIMPTAFNQFHEQHPGIDFDIKVDNTRALVGRLRQGEIDFAVGYNFPANVGLVFDEAIPLRLHAVVPIGHPLESRERITLADLARHKLIFPDNSLLIRQAFDHAIRQSRLQLNILVETNSFDLILRFVASGAGISIVTGHSGRKASEGRIAYIPIDEPQWGSNVLACCRMPNRSLSIAAQAFVDTIRTLLKSSVT